MAEPLYCTRCGEELGEGCCCEECMGPGLYCDVTGRLNCDCQYCAPSADEEGVSLAEGIHMKTRHLERMAERRANPECSSCGYSPCMCDQQ